MKISKGISVIKNSEKLESVQYKGALAITVAIQGISRDKIYQGLKSESLKSRRRYKRLSCMFKIIKEGAPNYLINLVPKCETNIRPRNNSIPTFNWRTDCFKYSFLPSTLNDWFNSESISIFKSRLLSFIRPIQTNIYNIFDPKCLTFLTRLRLGLSHLNEHRFRHSFLDYLNSCSLEIKDTSHYLLHCHHFSHHRVVLLNSVNSICDNFDSMPDNVKEDLLLYGDSRFNENKNRVILKAAINYIKSTERFSGSCFD